MKRITALAVVLALAAQSALAAVTITLSDSAAQELRTALGAPSVPPVVVTPPTTPVVTAVTYPIASLTNADKNFLGKALYQYRIDLKMIPGSHQLLEDMLVDAKGHNVTDFPPNDPLQYQINIIKNGVAPGGSMYDPSVTFANYTGPLKAIYANLVAKKKAGN